MFFERPFSGRSCRKQALMRDGLCGALRRVRAPFVGGALVDAATAAPLAEDPHHRRAISDAASCPRPIVWSTETSTRPKRSDPACASAKSAPVGHRRTADGGRGGARGARGRRRAGKPLCERADRRRCALAQARTESWRRRGVAISRPSSIAPRPLRLKWPNDVLIGIAKAGGVLVESTTARGAPGSVGVIGVGLNVVSRPVDLGAQPPRSPAME